MHFWTLNNPAQDSALVRYIPLIPIRFDSTVALVASWDPAIMAEMRRRGAEFTDFPAALDSLIPWLGTYSDSSVSRMYGQSRRFYFDHVEDPGRERAFRDRLRLPPGR